MNVLQDSRNLKTFILEALYLYLPSMIYFYVEFAADFMRGSPRLFFRLTGYFGQEYDLHFGREALNVHFSWKKI